MAFFPKEQASFNFMTTVTVKDLHAMFIATLFTISKTWKNSKAHQLVGR